MDKIIDLAKDMLEVGIDALSSGEIIKSIPVIKTIDALYSAGKNIRNERYVRNMQDFLLNLQYKTLHDRVKFVEECNKKDSEFQEVLITAIDEIEDTEKIKIIGNCSATLKQK